jgi:5-formyltetrahydrofolate cyclo-ligase
MNKKELRKSLLAERMSLDPVRMGKFQDLILIHFQQVALPFIQYLHTYLPIEGRNEPDPGLMVSMLEFRNPGLQIAVPKMVNDNEMLHIAVHNNSEWIKNDFGILEPAEGESLAPESFDLVFVPMLGCDLHGYRIGYGKGYYDRFLARCRTDTWKIGFSFLEPVEKIDDLGPWDIPLDICITPQRVYEFQ